MYLDRQSPDIRRRGRLGRHKSLVQAAPKSAAYTMYYCICPRLCGRAEWGHSQETTLPALIALAGLPWGWKLEGLAPPSGNGAGCRLQSLSAPTTGFPLQQESLHFLPYTGAQNRPFLRSVIVTASPLPHSVTLCQPRLQGGGGGGNSTL